MRARTRGTLALAVAAIALGGVAWTVIPVAGAGLPGVLSDEQSYEIGLFGDMPYGPQGRAQFPSVLADMNASNIAFSIFDGDIKNGSEPCYADFDGSAQAAGARDVYIYERDLFQTLEDPVVFVPGDNEWTDCDRPRNDGRSFDASRRLAYLREVFYPSDQTLGKRTFSVLRQSADYPENSRFISGPVTYITLNVPGSDNGWARNRGDGDVKQARAEYARRNAANLEWLTTSFAAARDAGSKGVMVVLQADMFLDPGKHRVEHYADTKARLAELTVSYPGQVVLVNGDSHYFLQDKPLRDEAGNAIPNFTRVMTFGDGLHHWVSATVDPDDPGIFRFRQRLVPRTPHPRSDVTTVATSTGDTYVSELAPNANYGRAYTLRSRGVPQFVAYLRFDVPAAPEGSVLTRAALRLRTSPDASAASKDRHDVYLADDDWTETAMTWRNHPFATGPAVGTISAGTAPDSVYDTPLNTETVAGLLGKRTALAISNDGFDAIVFWSEEHPAADRRPQLVLTFGDVSG